MKNRFFSIDYSELKEDKIGYAGQGPLKKGAGAAVLEEIMQKLMDPNQKCQFKHQHGKIVLEVAGPESKGTTSYDLVPLFQSANLQFVEINDEFLKYFLNQCNQFKTIEKPSEFETLWEDRRKAFNDELRKTLNKTLENVPAEQAEKIIFDQLHNLLAYQYAAKSYTGIAYIQINAFLRGDTTFAAEIDAESFHERMMYLFGLIILNASLPAKIPYRHNEGDLSKVPNSGVVKAYRIETIPETQIGRISLLKHAKLAQEHKTNTFAVHVPAFTSTSQDHFAFKLMNQKIITGNEKTRYILYQFPGLQQRLIKTLSILPSENEILLPPGTMKLTVEQNDVFVIVKAEVISPLETEKLYQENKQTVPVLHAMQYVLDQYYSKPFSKAQKYEPDLEMEMTASNGRQIKIQRPNHGLAHAARQARNVEEVLHLISIFSNDECKKISNEVLQNNSFLEIAQIVMLFYSSGREHEKRHENDEPYIAAQQYFSEYMLKFYLPAIQVDSETKNRLVKFIDMCAFCLAFPDEQDALLAALNKSNPIEFLRTHPTLKNIPHVKNLLNNLSNEDVWFLYTLSHVLVVSHELDVPRFPLVELKDGQRVVTNPKTLVDKRLFADGLLSENLKQDKQFIAARDKLWSDAITRIEQSGDRLYEEKTQQFVHGHQSQFIDASLNPKRCAELIGLDVVHNSILLCPREKETVTDETSLQFMYYQLTLFAAFPKDFAAQMDEFLKPESPLFKMLTSGIKFLSEQKEIKPSAVEALLNKEVQKSCLKKLIVERKKSPDEELNQFLQKPGLKTLMDWASFGHLHASKIGLGPLFEFYCLMDQVPLDDSLLIQFLKKHNVNIDQMSFGGQTALEYAFSSGKRYLALYIMRRSKTLVSEAELKAFLSNPMRTDEGGGLANVLSEIRDVATLVAKKTALPIHDFLKVIFETTEDNSKIYHMVKDLSKEQFSQALLLAVKYKNNVALTCVIENARHFDKQEIFQAMVFSIQQKNSAALKILAKLPFDVNHADGNGRTILHQAAFMQDEDLVETILTLPIYPKVDVDAKDTDGNTALHLLCGLKGSKISVSLVEKTDTHIKNKAGLTAFDVLLSNKELITKDNAHTLIAVMESFLTKESPFNLQHCHNPELILLAFKKLNEPRLFESLLKGLVENPNVMNQLSETSRIDLLKWIHSAINATNEPEQVKLLYKLRDLALFDQQPKPLSQDMFIIIEIKNENVSPNRLEKIINQAERLKWYIDYRIASFIHDKKELNEIKSYLSALKGEVKKLMEFNDNVNNLFSLQHSKKLEPLLQTLNNFISDTNQTIEQISDGMSSQFININHHTINNNEKFSVFDNQIKNKNTGNKITLTKIFDNITNKKFGK